MNKTRQDVLSYSLTVLHTPNVDAGPADTYILQKKERITRVPWGEVDFLCRVNKTYFNAHAQIQSHVIM